MSGDGYSIPLHCINAYEDDWWYEPPDSGPYYCGYTEDHDYDEVQ